MARRTHPATVVALARQVNRAIGHDPKLRAAGIKPLPIRLVMRPWDPERPDGPWRPVTRQSGGPNRADRRFAESKHKRKLAAQAALESAARVAAKAVDA